MVKLCKWPESNCVKRHYLLVKNSLETYLSMKNFSVDNVFCQFVVGHDDQVVWIADS